MRYFHLTVDKNGLVSLWDTMRAAEDGKQNGEIIVLMALTKHQEAMLETARKAAK